MEMELLPGTTLDDLWAEAIIDENWMIYGYEDFEDRDDVVWYGSVERVFDLAAEKEVFSINEEYKTITLK